MVNQEVKDQVQDHQIVNIALFGSDNQDWNEWTDTEMQRSDATKLSLIHILTGTKVNQTSADGLFSLDATRCLGACGLAPVAILDDQVYGNATSSTALEDRIKAIIKTESGVQ